MTCLVDSVNYPMISTASTIMCAIWVINFYLMIINKILTVAIDLKYLTNFVTLFSPHFIQFPPGRTMGPARHRPSPTPHAVVNNAPQKPSPWPEDEKDLWRHLCVISCLVDSDQIYHPPTSVLRLFPCPRPTIEEQQRDETKAQIFRVSFGSGEQPFWLWAAGVQDMWILWKIGLGGCWRIWSSMWFLWQWLGQLHSCPPRDVLLVRLPRCLSSSCVVLLLTLGY